jgi:ribosomal protein L29
MNVNRIAGLFVLILALGAGRADAQRVTTQDIQRLQDSLSNASRDISQARSRDASLAPQLEAELDDLQDETIYLKVKLRKNESVAYSDYEDVRKRIADLRTRAQGRSDSRTWPSASETSASSRSTGAARSEVPADTELDVRLQKRLSSATAQVEDRVEATTMVDLRDGEGDRVLIPAGSVMRGTVDSVTKAGRIERKGSLTLRFDQITIRGRAHPINATVVQALESGGIKEELPTIGAGAGIGAVIGGILGGTKGALAGILIGGGGVVAATEGKDVELPPGTTLRVKLISPPALE